MKQKVIERLITLYEVSHTINQIQELDKLLNTIMDLVVGLLQAERGLLIFNKKDSEIIVARNITKKALKDIHKISYQTISKVKEKRTSLLVTDAQTDPQTKKYTSIIKYGIKSLICVPLQIKGKIIGTIYLDSRLKTKIFSKDDLKFLINFANLAAVAIENAMLYESLKKANLELKEEVIHLHQELKEKHQFKEIIGTSPLMQKVYQAIEQVLNNSVPVLIEGETGTGKELVARAIHYNGIRQDQNFVTISCAALPENLLESELFGYKKGAFTGASEDKKGLFEIAHKGTLFLDDVSELSPGIQAKLLRVIQFGEFRRIGETKNRKIDVRIISSTNKDLKKEVEAKRFREDLYYRLKVMTIKLPPLRNRKEDIPLLVHHFVKKYGPSLNPKVTQINKEAMQVLKSYPWPGGVRELENIIQQILIVTQNTTIEVRNLPEELQNWYQNHKTKELPFDIAVEQFEKERIIKALEESNWNQSEAARKLKIPIPKIQRKIKKYKISKP